MMGGSWGWLLAAGLVVLVGLFIVLTIRHNLRIRHVRRIYKTVPNTVKEEVIRWIAEAAKESPAVTFLRLDEEHPCKDKEELLQSHVGGRPYAEAGEAWPSGESAQFLLQVRLDEPGLGERWQGRLITVFLEFDSEQVVRSYARPSLDRYVALAAPVAPLPCIRLTSLRIPVEADEQNFPASPLRLCESVPAIREVLSPFTHDPAGLLAQILSPHAYGHHLEAPAIAYVGGEPKLIQNAHNALCEECGQPMRFLFQFGELFPGLQLGDNGVGYIYGCDEHPHRCTGFIDSH